MKNSTNIVIPYKQIFYTAVVGIKLLVNVLFIYLLNPEELCMWKPIDVNLDVCLEEFYKIS